MSHAAVLSPDGTPAQVIARWLAGEFELVVSEALLRELGRALACPKIRSRVSAADAASFLDVLRGGASLAPDPVHVPRRSPDPGDD